jgi:hypothetical protein
MAVMRRAELGTAVLLAFTLGSAGTALVYRLDRRPTCAESKFQFKYEANGFLDFNSYADIRPRVCLLHSGEAEVRVRMSVQGQIIERYVFAPRSTWADLTVTVAGEPLPSLRCDFPEAAATTVAALHYERTGSDRVLTKRCVFPLPAGDDVVLRLVFHGVERRGSHAPETAPLELLRIGGRTRCTVGGKVKRCRH